MSVTKASTSSINTFAKYNVASAGEVATGPAQFVVITTTNQAITSSDGITWTPRTVTGLSGPITWFGKNHGVYGIVKVETTGQAWSSPDGITWSYASSIPYGTNQVRAIYQENYFDSTGIYGYGWRTDNPSNHWVFPNKVEQVTSPGTNYYTYGSAQNGNIIVRAGSRYTSTGQPTLDYSTNGGVTWGTNNMGGSENIGCFKPAYGNGMFVVSGGASGVWSSSNGSSWTQRNGSVTGRYVWFANGLFFCGSYSGSTLYTSPDGITWSSRTSGLSTPVRCVFYGNGLYVATGGSGQLSTSTNAISWTSRSTGTTNQLDWGIYA
jgi:hypothetical protein